MFYQYHLPITFAFVCGLVWVAPGVHAQALTKGASEAVSRAAPGAMKDRFIVMLRKDLPDPKGKSDELMNEIGRDKVHKVYTNAINGFSATLPPQALERMKNNKNVVVVPDAIFRVKQSPATQNNAPWSLDRIDQADRLLDNQYRYSHTGRNVYAFIIDTGIRLAHTEFTGRLVTGADFVGDNRGPDDCNGHGTHVAGTVGGTTWGVAKQVKLVPVRVLDCEGGGNLSDVLAGVDYVAGSTLRPAVANLSLGGERSEVLNTAVAALTAKGVTVVVAAGNDGTDACTRSPASEPSAITVGATIASDQVAPFSNVGPCVDLYAPGADVISASVNLAAPEVKSGTSQAAPHVTGVVALALEQNPKATPEVVAEFLRQQGTANRISGLAPTWPNILVYSRGTFAAAPVIREVAVAQLVGSTIKIRNTWQATATVSVRDLAATGGAVVGATVYAKYETGGPVACTTDQSGRCTLVGPAQLMKVGRNSLLIESIRGERLNYLSSQNSVSQITIPKP